MWNSKCKSSIKIKANKKYDEKFINKDTHKLTYDDGAKHQSMHAKRCREIIECMINAMVELWFLPLKLWM